MKPINNTTIPGIRPGADYSILTSDEIEICKKLSGRYWYLTRFNQRKIAGSDIKGETFRLRESTTWIYRPIAHELVSDGIGMSACDCNIPDTYFRQNDLG